MAVSDKRLLRSFMAGILASVMAAGASAQSPESAEDWLRWSQEARSQHSFVAEFIYQHQDHVDTMRIWRSAHPDAGVQERLFSLSGEPREIIRDHEEVTCVLPSAQAVMVDRRHWQAPLDARLPDSLSDHEPHYRGRVIGEDRVAGRPTQRVAILAEDAMRYGYQLWFDQETGLLMRAELVSSEGDVLERVMMLDMELRDGLEPTELMSQLPQEGFKRVTARATPSADDQPIDASSWSVADLPDGFQLHMEREQALPGRDQAARHLLFSDGIATVSIYIEAETPDEGMRGALRMGAMNVYTTTMDGYQVVALGEVPSSTVERMATSLQRADSTSNASH